MSPPPREREGDHDEKDEPTQRHPPCGVEPHEVGASARLRAELVPAPAVLVGLFDLVCTVCGFSCVRHADSWVIDAGSSGYPNVNEYALAPGSRKLISSVRSRTV